MEYGQWLKRNHNRTDITSRITHLTKGKDDDEAFDNLCKILIDKKIIAGLGYICGTKKVTCFQEAPLLSIAENLRFEKYLRENEGTNKIRYSAFGLRIHKSDIYKEGGRPVIYGKSDELKTLLPKDEWWRIVDFDLSNSNDVTDWTHEREWRVPGDFSLRYERIEIIVSGLIYYKKFIEWCDKNGHMDILKGINGIITLDSISC